MEPRIQYAQTADGVSIAFWTMGEGKPLVLPSDITFGHVLDWQIPPFRTAYEQLGKGRILIHYDGRGNGLSDRDAPDFSLDARLLDIEAIADRLSLERFALFGSGTSGLVTVAYAARYPERVSHLILWCSYARASDYFELPQSQAFFRLLDTDWETFVETFVHARGTGWSQPESADLLAKLVRENFSLEYVKAAVDRIRAFDVTHLLPNVKSPTLVLHRRQVRAPTATLGRELAARIPDARLALLEGESAVPWLGDMDSVLNAIDEFLGEGEEASRAAELPEGMAVLLFADIAESTALTEQFGDAAFRAKARELDTSLRSVIRESGGTPVEGKVLGDGVLAVFTSTRGAIDCALRCDAASQPLGLRLHLGIHAGDVIREGNNVYGGAVNIAARIAAASEPGEVLVSDTVRSLGRTSADVTFDDRGEHTLKGVGEPQRLFAVRGGVDG